MPELPVDRKWEIVANIKEINGWMWSKIRSKFAEVFTKERMLIEVWRSKELRMCKMLIDNEGSYVHIELKNANDFLTKT